MRRPILTRRELATELGISERYLDILRARGTIPSFTIGRSRRFSLPDVLDALGSPTETPNAQPSHEAGV